MLKTYLASLTVALLVAPLYIFAQGAGSPTPAGPGDLEDVSDFVTDISTFISKILIPFIFSLALIVFLYGVFNYFILGGGDESKREEGRKLMLWAIIAFVVMISIFGIVNLIAGGLGFSESETFLRIPDAPGADS